MEALFGDVILKDNVEVEADEVLGQFKEFLFVFYGAAWCNRSYQIASALSNFLIDQNPEDDNSYPNYEILYISND